jgi:putative membrane protein
MSRITFRTIMLVSALTALVLSFNLFVGAQEETTGTNSNKNPQSKTTDTKRDQDMNKSASAGTSTTGMLSAADKKFVMEAAHGGMMEVDLGKLAAQKAMSEEVKQFGQRMVDDHSKANDELMQLASSKGITLNHSSGTSATSGGTDSQTTSSTTQTSSTGQTSSAQTTGANTMSGPRSSGSDDETKMMKKHQDMVSKMSALSGAEFDRKYMEHMVKDHEKDVAAFERESTAGSDADVKAWAAKTLPTLREHLQLARDTHMKVKAGSKASTNNK